MKKLKPMLLVVMVCMLALLGIPAAAKAAAAPVCPKKQTIMIEKCRDWNSGQKYTNAEGYIFIKNLAKNAKIVNIKSSNPKFGADWLGTQPAIAVGQENPEDDMGIQHPYTIKSGEKTKISFTVKQNGKSYNLSCEVICVPFRKQFKNFQIGSQGYAALFNGYQKAFKKSAVKNGKAKLTIKTTDDYKIDYIVLYYGKEPNVKSVVVKSGTMISLKDIRYIDVVYYTSKFPLYRKIENWRGKEEPNYYRATLYFDNAPWTPNSSLNM